MLKNKTWAIFYSKRQNCFRLPTHYKGSGRAIDCEIEVVNSNKNRHDMSWGLTFLLITKIGKRQFLILPIQMV